MEFRRLRAAFDAPVTVERTSAEWTPKVLSLWSHVPARLAAFGLGQRDFLYRPNVVYVARLGAGGGRVTVLGNEADGPAPMRRTSAAVVRDGGNGGGPAEVARRAATVALAFGYTGSFTVALALRRAPKTLPQGRPATYHDVCGGVTLQNERLVILWRDDADFWKVLMHELVHLMTSTSDEALAEATALRMWCALRSSTQEEYENAVRMQTILTTENARRVAALARGTTTAIADYTAGAACILSHGSRACRDWRHDFRQEPGAATPPGKPYVASIQCSL